MIADGEGVSFVAGAKELDGGGSAHEEARRRGLDRAVSSMEGGEERVEDGLMRPFVVCGVGGCELARWSLVQVGRK